MNAVFATTTSNKKQSQARIKKLRLYCKQKKYPIKVVSNKTGTCSIAYCSDNGKVVGRADKSGVILILHGFIYKPLPKWVNDSTPIDDPNKAAQYLLERYFSYGPNLTKDIYGHFSVTILDTNNDSIIIARDPLGQNDSYVFTKDSQLAFCTKLSILTAALEEEVSLDRTYEDFFLEYGFYPENRTMFKHIKMLPKQSVLTSGKDKAEINQIVYKALPKAGKISDEDQLINDLYKKLVQATKNIIPSEQNKVAVLLGGFDSALVASLLKQQGKEVETFSFYYSDNKYNQAHTDTVANYLGIKHNWVKISSQTIKQGLNEFSDKFSQPTNWPSYVIQTAYLCEIIRKRGFDYCYTGDGCDALFYGYPLTFKRAEVLAKIGSMPNFLLKAIIKLVERPTLERYIGRPYQVGLGALRSAQRPESQRSLLTFRIFDRLSIKQLRCNQSPASAEDSEDIVVRLTKAHTKMSRVAQAYEGKKLVSPNKNKMNGSADVSGLVIVSPYMHPLVGAFAKTIPDKLLRPKDGKVITGKYLLSKMAEQKMLLPSEVIYQPKIGAADSPIEQWYRGVLSNTVNKLLKDLPFKYNKKYVQSLTKDKLAERLYAKLISRDTNNIVTLSHCISLLLTYSSFTKGRNG